MLHNHQPDEVENSPPRLEPPIEDESLEPQSECPEKLAIAYNDNRTKEFFSLTCDDGLLKAVLEIWKKDPQEERLFPRAIESEEKRRRYDIARCRSKGLKRIMDLVNPSTSTRRQRRPGQRQRRTERYLASMLVAVLSICTIATAEGDLEKK